MQGLAELTPLPSKHFVDVMCIYGHWPGPGAADTLRAPHVTVEFAGLIKEVGVPIKIFHTALEC